MSKNARLTTIQAVSGTISFLSSILVLLGISRCRPICVHNPFTYRPNRFKDRLIDSGGPGRPMLLYRFSDLLMRPLAAGIIVAALLMAVCSDIQLHKTVGTQAIVCSSSLLIQTEVQ